jgi:hypothetical protein
MPTDSLTRSDRAYRTAYHIAPWRAAYRQTKSKSPILGIIVYTSFHSQQKEMHPCP